MNYSQIKHESKEALRGNWFLILLIIALIDVATVSIIGDLVSPVLFAGLILTLRHMLKTRQVNFNLVFEYFKDLNHALKLFAVALLYCLIVFAGFILLIIPGIIFSLQYSQAIYIMAEDKDLDIFDALRKSREMMVGYKMDLFIFYFSFIPNILLVFITLGIYGLYFIPYFYTAMVNYYLHLSKQNDTVEVIG
jgi:uncharacterized membrane protein